MIELLSPPSVMLRKLIIRASETSIFDNCYYSLLVEIKSDFMESYKVSKTL